MLNENKRDHRLSDEGCDAIAAVVIITVVVIGVVFWLYAMPS